MDRPYFARCSEPCRRQFGRLLWGGLACSLLGCATGDAPPPPEVRAAIAPQGRLRAAINLGNPILARRQGSAVDGVSVDLANALAEQLRLPLDCQVLESAAASVAAVKSGQADVGFFAVDPVRGADIRFTHPYLRIEGAYLVRQDSALQRLEEVDRPGVRIMVGQGSAYDLYLSREIRYAQLLRAPSSPRVVDEFLAQGVEVAAGVRQQLLADAQRIGGLRLLPGRFMRIDQAMGLSARRGEVASAWLAGFVDRARQGTLVLDALARHHIEGADVLRD